MVRRIMIGNVLIDYLMSYRQSCWESYTYTGTNRYYFGQFRKSVN
jgi:hypothetical protein